SLAPRCFRSPRNSILVRHSAMSRQRSPAKQRLQSKSPSISLLPTKPFPDFMKTTREGPIPPYIGADLTDRYARDVRPIDVCVLFPSDSGDLEPVFYTWTWEQLPPAPLDVDAIAPELSTAVCVMLDGPQGLATIGESMRRCERQCGAAGKT